MNCKVWTSSLDTFPDKRNPVIPVNYGFTGALRLLSPSRSGEKAGPAEDSEPCHNPVTPAPTLDLRAKLLPNGSVIQQRSPWQPKARNTKVGAGSQGRTCMFSRKYADIIHDSTSYVNYFRQLILLRIVILGFLRQIKRFLTLVGVGFNYLFFSCSPIFHEQAFDDFLNFYKILRTFCTLIEPLRTPAQQCWRLETYQSSNHNQHHFGRL